MRVLHGSAEHLFAWLDQAIVSAVSFVTLIMLGRWTDPSMLGAFAIACSVLTLLAASQDALITRPYAIKLHDPIGTAGEHAFHSLALCLVLAMAGTLVIGTGALAFAVSETERVSAQMTGMLAGVIPFILVREFARRFAFAHLRTFQALLLDVAVAVVNFALLGYFGWTGHLSALTALLSLGVACGLGGLGWLYLTRRQFTLRWARLAETFRQSWSLGKWLLSGQLAVQAQGYVTLWLSLVIGGPAASGIYAAALSIVSFANPLLFGFYNILAPRAVRALQCQGATGLRRQAASDSLLLALLMTPFCLLIYVFGADLQRMLYPSVEYGADTHLLAILALGTFAGAVGVPAAVALSSAERARAAARVRIAAAALNIVLVSILMALFGLLGAAYGMLTAELAGSLGCWLVLLLSFSDIERWSVRSSQLASGETAVAAVS